jgi:hypothetical protein
MKIYLILLIIAVISHKGLSQTINLNDTTEVAEQTNTVKETKSSFMERSYFGGSLGLMFGSYTQIGIYPLYGYKINPKLSVGTMISYEYVSDKQYKPTFTTSTYGGSLFTRYRIIPQFYAHVEYAQMNYELFDYYGGPTGREWVPFLYVGGGYCQLMGGRSWMYMQILFDVLQDSRSPYESGDPIFSVGVGVGF